MEPSTGLALPAPAPAPAHALSRVGCLPGWWDRALGLGYCLPHRGEGALPATPRGPLSVGSPVPSPDPELHASLLLALHLSSSSVITVRVKEEHLDVAMADKAPSPELPVPVENIKQEMDD